MTATIQCAIVDARHRNLSASGKRQHPVRLAFNASTNMGKLEGQKGNLRRASRRAFLTSSRPPIRVETEVGKSHYEEFSMPIHLVPVYDPATSAVSDAIVLNPKQLSALATWLCDRTCSYDSRTRDAEIERNDGYCDDCRDMAGFLIAECPFVDMGDEGRA